MTFLTNLCSKRLAGRSMSADGLIPLSIRRGGRRRASLLTEGEEKNPVHQKSASATHRRCTPSRRASWASGSTAETLDTEHSSYHSSLMNYGLSTAIPASERAISQAHVAAATRKFEQVQLRQLISRGKVGRTAAFFEQLASQSKNVRRKISRRSSIGPGVEALRTFSNLRFPQYQEVKEFWASLPQPSTTEQDDMHDSFPKLDLPPSLRPEMSRSNSLHNMPYTFRDIALTASDRCTLAQSEHEPPSRTSSNDSCSTVCLYDGENLFLSLPQGCMVFRPNREAYCGLMDQVPRAPPRRSSTMSRTSLGTARKSKPRVRINEAENIVWIIDDLVSCFSDDGLELAQDFNSIFAADNTPPRRARRRGSNSDDSIDEDSIDEDYWEYVGFYDELELPQDFSKTLRGGSGTDSAPRAMRRRRSIEPSTMLGDMNEDSSRSRDRAPNQALRRGSMNDSSESFFWDSPPTSPLRSRGDSEPHPISRRSSITSIHSASSLSPVSSPVKSPKIDVAPKIMRRRASLEMPMTPLTGEIEGEEATTLVAIVPSAAHMTPPQDPSPRRVFRRGSIEAELPVVPSLLQDQDAAIDENVKILNETAPYTLSPARKAAASAMMDALLKFRMLDKIHQPPPKRTRVSHRGSTGGIAKAFSWSKGDRGVWKKRPRRPQRCGSTGGPMGHESGDEDYKRVGRVIEASSFHEVPSTPLLCGADDEDDNSESSDSSVDSAISEVTDIFTEAPPVNHGLRFLSSSSNYRNHVRYCTPEQSDSDGSRQEEKKLPIPFRPACFRGHSFSDNDSMTVASLVSRNSASLDSSHDSLRPTCMCGTSFDSTSSMADSLTAALKQNSLTRALQQDPNRRSRVQAKAPYMKYFGEALKRSDEGASRIKRLAENFQGRPPSLQVPY